MKLPTPLSLRAASRRALLLRPTPAHVRAVTSGRPYGMQPDEPGADKEEAQEYDAGGTDPQNKNYMYIAGGVLGLGAVYMLYSSRKEKEEKKA
ncbi:hypothetical protein VTJ83DRAFT_7079 [Remersonia thermophila]|uniref:Gram-positive cocci surface proteins LPxTG domain-containing protein n=1 Tax=Remersonia thermophila TaxID=72144 RepID=A0ABR4D4Q4_9PEZI